MARWVCLWFVCSRIFPFTLLLADGVTASTSRSLGMLYMPPWISQTFYSQRLKCSSISVGSEHKPSCLLSLSGFGREYDPVSPCTSTAHTVQVFPPLSQPRHDVFCVQRLRPDPVRVAASHLQIHLPDRSRIGNQRVVSHLARASGWYGG